MLEDLFTFISCLDLALIICRRVNCVSKHAITTDIGDKTSVRHCYSGTRFIQGSRHCLYMYLNSHNDCRKVDFDCSHSQNASRAEFRISNGLPSNSKTHLSTLFALGGQKFLVFSIAGNQTFSSKHSGLLFLSLFP